MVILYFRTAVLTPTDPEKTVATDSLAHATIKTLFLIFVLYAAWDLCGILMATITTKYPKIGADAKQPSNTPAEPDWRGWAITLFALALVAVLFFVTRSHELGTRGAEACFILITALLLFYRLLKEVRTSVQLAQTGAPAQPVSDGSTA
jgi:peptidoglycan/LPS O-acetylase OafA/YrhL